MTLHVLFGTVAETAFWKTTAGLVLTLSKSNLPQPFAPSLSLALSSPNPTQLRSPWLWKLRVVAVCLPEQQHPKRSLFKTLNLLFVP